MKTLLLTALSVASVSAAGGDKWNYIKNGADWIGKDDKGVDWKCVGAGLKRQTPINLVSQGKADFKYPLIEGVRDDRSYVNQKDVKNVWNGHTTQVNLKKSSTFSSSIPMNHYGAKYPMTFRAQQFHFHAPSEHTIDGEYMDLEMHTVHYPDEADQGSNNNESFIAAALGINFSVEKFTAKVSAAEQMIIDNFFDSLQWGNMKDTSPDVSNVAYGNLVNMIDFHNRWVYSGSVTTPPCATKVFWNEIATIYPIKQAHLDLFKKRLDLDKVLKDGLVGGDVIYENSKIYTEKKLSEYGNYRIIHPVDDHNVMYVTSGSASGSGSGSSIGGVVGGAVDTANTVAEAVGGDRSLLVAALIVLVLVFILSLVLLCMTCKGGKSGSQNEGGQAESEIIGSSRSVNLDSQYQSRVGDQEKL